MLETGYQPRLQARTSMISVLDSRYQIRSWGPPDAPPLVLLHGTRDTSATFQFLVDAFKGRWHFIAPDWRGHGGTESVEQAGWFHNFVADLDIVLDTLLPDGCVNLIGHSLGGNVASTYAGLRPARVRHMVSIDAFGIVPPVPEAVVDVLTKWLDGIARSRTAQKTYASIDLMAQALVKANPRLTKDKAVFLAANSSRQVAHGAFTWAFDSGMRRSIQAFHSLDEWIACWKRIRAPTLWIGASHPMEGTVTAHAEALRRVVEQIGSDRVIFVQNTGHNVQHDAPRALAAIIEAFLTADEDRKLARAIEAGAHALVRPEISAAST